MTENRDELLRDFICHCCIKTDGLRVITKHPVKGGMLSQTVLMYKYSIEESSRIRVRIKIYSASNIRCCVREENKIIVFEKQRELKNFYNFQWSKGIP